jgi:hypothetical protein
MADDIAAPIGRPRPDKPGVAGHSLGGLSLHTAAKHPDLVG